VDPPAWPDLNPITYALFGKCGWGLSHEFCDINVLLHMNSAHLLLVWNIKCKKTY